MLLLIVLVLSGSVLALANENINYKTKYEQQLNVNRGMAATAIMILNWFKDHPEYKQFNSIKSRVGHFYDILNKAKIAHFRALDLAKKEMWENAYKSLKEEWNYLNDIAVKGKKTQDDLIELEGKQKTGKGSEDEK